MLFDSHCHIQFSQYDPDRDEILDQCRKNGVSGLCVGCDEKSSRDAIEFAEKNENFWASVGIHPTEWNASLDMDVFRKLIKQSKKVVAIGETGLDYYRIPQNAIHDSRFTIHEGEGENAIQESGIRNQEEDHRKLKENQKRLFLDHIALAKETQLPLIIHCRDAHADVQEILKKVVPGTTLLGVLHCFTGTIQDALAYLELGFFISFTGIITFARQYDEVVHRVPLEKILIETDSPFLTPVPHRGKRNSPLYVEYVARRIAEIKGISYEEVARQTTENAQLFFSLSSLT